MPFPEISESVARSPNSQLRFWLVAGQILGVEYREQETVVSIRIDHVYAGPDALNGRDFEARFSLDFSHAQFFDEAYTNTFAKGQRLVTAVELMNRIHRKDDAHLIYSRGLYGFPLPTILDGTTQAREIEAHAQRVEAIYRADAGARRAKMKEYARASLPITTDWAFSAVRGWNDAESYEFFQQLSTEAGVSLKKLFFIYGIFRRGKTHELWMNSPERAEIVARIALALQSSDGKTKAQENLSPTGQHLHAGQGVISAVHLVELYKAFVDNPEVSDANRLLAVTQIEFLDLPKDDVFPFWVSLLSPDAPGGTARKSALAEPCAQALLRNAPWSPEQNAQLQKLADGLKVEAQGATKEQASILIFVIRILEHATTLPIAMK